MVRGQAGRLGLEVASACAIALRPGCARDRAAARLRDNCAPGLTGIVLSVRPGAQADRYPLAGFRARLFGDDPPLLGRRVVPLVRRAVLPVRRAALAALQVACFAVPRDVDAARDAFCLA